MSTRPHKNLSSRSRYGHYLPTDTLYDNDTETVYLARHAATNAPAEVVCLKPGAEMAPDRWNDVRAEMRKGLSARQALGAHLNIQRIIDSGETEGLLYIVFERVEGRSLQRMITDAGRMSFETVLPIFKQIALFIDFASSLGLPHSGLNPGTVMLRTRDQRICILRYGITPDQSSHQLPYLAPGRIMDRTGDMGTDIYSLGAMLYYCLSGRPPYLSTLGIGDRTPPQAFASMPMSLVDQPLCVRQALGSLLSGSAGPSYRSAIDFVQELESCYSAGRSPHGSPETRTEEDPIDGFTVDQEDSSAQIERRQRWFRIRHRQGLKDADRNRPLPRLAGSGQVTDAGSERRQPLSAEESGDTAA